MLNPFRLKRPLVYEPDFGRAFTRVVAAGTVDKVPYNDHHDQSLFVVRRLDGDILPCDEGPDRSLAPFPILSLLLPSPGVYFCFRFFDFLNIRGVAIK